MRLIPARFSLLLAFCLLPLAIHAEPADRDQPVHLEAGRVTVDDIKRIHVFEGNVVLRRGSLLIRSAKLVVTQDEEGFQKGVATGGENGLARFRQKRQGRDEYVYGEAERIEYDARTEQAEFFVRAFVQSGNDEVRGNYIHYDAISEQYLVTAAPGAKAADNRVRAVIQPRNAREDAQPAAR